MSDEFDLFKYVKQARVDVAQRKGLSLSSDYVNDDITAKVMANVLTHMEELNRVTVERGVSLDIEYALFQGITSDYISKLGGEKGQAPRKPPRGQGVGFSGPSGGGPTHVCEQCGKTVVG